MNFSHVNEPLFQSNNQHQVFWASALDKQMILKSNIIFERQTMNLRVMEKAKIAVVKKNNTIVAHAGIDHEYSGQFPEFFSYFVHEDWRNKGIGSVLEKFVCEYSLSQNILHLYLRVSSEGEDFLDSYRQKTGCFEEINMPFKFLSLCQRCELFGKKCKTQKFLKLDVLKRVGQLRFNE